MIPHKEQIETKIKNVKKRKERVTWVMLPKKNNFMLGLFPP